MAKWRKPVDPTEAEANKAVAEMLPALRIQRDTLIASWNGVFPENIGHAVSQEVVKPALLARFGAEYSAVKSMVQALLLNDLEKPAYAAYHRMKAEQEKAAAALVDTHRPIVATTLSSGKDRIGSFTIITQRGDRMHERDQVLVCIDSGYDPGDNEERESGWRSSYAEPNDAEKQTPEYRQLVAKVAEDQAYEQRQQQIIADRRRAELDAIRAEGREPTLFEDLFAGTSDN